MCLPGRQVASDLFGWRKNDLEGKNMVVILPPPYNLVTYIKRCTDTESVLDAVEVRM